MFQSRERVVALGLQAPWPLAAAEFGTRVWNKSEVFFRFAGKSRSLAPHRGGLGSARGSPEQPLRDLQTTPAQPHQDPETGLLALSPGRASLA